MPTFAVVARPSVDRAQAARRSRYPMPFVKWAGGKTQLLDTLLRFVPDGYRTYYEPFIGGGALFFALRPARAVIGDVNDELINCYEIIRSNPNGLMQQLDRHQYQRDYFNRLRAIQPVGLTPLERAARFIYLNKSCFNGLYRVNKRGEFNVPFGSYKTTPRYYDEENVRAAGALLMNTRIVSGRFDETLENASEGDFIYLDPPYQPVSGTSFTSYTADRFLEHDQLWLKAQVDALTEKGCRVMLSNSDTAFTRWLYADYQMTVVRAVRAINSDGNGRAAVNEIIIRNY